MTPKSVFSKTSVLIACAALVLPSSSAAETAAERKARILAPTNDFTKAEQFEELQGGSGTNTTRFDTNAFSLPSGALSFEERSDFFIGNGVFDRPWVPAPSSTIASDGLGPLFNARSCQGCHIKDGRGHPPEPGDVNMVSMLFGLSDADGGPDPVFGHQFQDQAIVGFQSEGKVTVAYEDLPFTYGDGTTVMLRQPVYTTSAPLAPSVSLNPRIAPPMIGLGLIEAITPEAIAAHTDPNDLDRDGISGRLPMVGEKLGRFGWKAMAPTLLAQTTTAFSNDMGLSTRVRPASWGDCTKVQDACLGAIHGDDDGNPEIADELLELVVFYSKHLAVPARRDVNDPQVLRGKQLFYETQCVACHVPKFATSADADAPLRNQLIWPYSDFLLHDLGEGLADQNPTADRRGSEWRTTPLWGIGMTETVNGHTFFLHDGRARSLEEAILWHGGEALTARDNFAALTSQERADVIRFLESL
ncbi:MAG: di-heme oxidoredictase family protein [Pseudomonadota bacterium]